MTSRNPWLDVKASEYEGHMGHPKVAQLEFLARILAQALGDIKPAALAVPGSAMGTGFEHIDGAVTDRVLAVDINSEYLDILKTRYGEGLPGLEIACADLAQFTNDGESFDLVFAALVFEYLPPGPLLKKFASWLRVGGSLCSVLQLPGEGQHRVSDTPFSGVKVLEPVLKLVEPAAFKSQAAGVGLKLVDEHVHRLASGKEFHVGRFIKQG